VDLDDLWLWFMLLMEGVEGFEGDFVVFEDWWEWGVCLVSLIWNYLNEFVGGIEMFE